MKKLLTVFALLLLISASSFGQIEKGYSKTLKKMFEVSGTEQTYQVAITHIFTMFKDVYPAVEQEVWDGLEKEFSSRSINELTEMLVPVYAKYMTRDDLKDLIKFFETPVGKKFAKNTPFIMEESMLIGQEWGKKIGEDFAKKMEEKGY